VKTIIQQCTVGALLFLPEISSRSENIQGEYSGQRRFNPEKTSQRIFKPENIQADENRTFLKVS
jgi:hypothetical protein